MASYDILCLEIDTSDALLQEEKHITNDENSIFLYIWAYILFIYNYI